mmetsp:Transcript_16739/g.28728  ORF Transcript_16739/g.28728 Transcript_16739/m.28728 type:complete len:89 (+) Transcript_16739:227-493(+)
MVVAALCSGRCFAQGRLCRVALQEHCFCPGGKEKGVSLVLVEIGGPWQLLKVGAFASYGPWWRWASAGPEEGEKEGVACTVPTRVDAP